MATNIRTMEDQVERTASAVESSNKSDNKARDRHNAHELEIAYVPDTEQEKKLVRKLDWRLIVGRGKTTTPSSHTDTALALLLGFISTGLS